MPRQEKTYAFERAASSVDAAVPELACSLGELGEVSVYPVSSRYAKESKIWFALLDRYHYLGSGPLCGAQIRYVVKSSLRLPRRPGLQFGVVGACVPGQVYRMDGSSARRAHLDRVICNSRFLILPTVQGAEPRLPCAVSGPFSCGRRLGAPLPGPSRPGGDVCRSRIHRHLLQGCQLYVCGPERRPERRYGKEGLSLSSLSEVAGSSRSGTGGRLGKTSGP